jgi:hypothetical protein
LVNVEGLYSETEEDGVEATWTVQPPTLEGVVSQNPAWISRQFVDGEELSYLYWDPKIEPKVGPGADADENEEGNEGNSERGVEAEVVPGSSTEAGNILGEEEYGEDQSGTNDQIETESDAEGADSDHEGSPNNDDSAAREVPDVCVCHTDCLEAHEIPSVCTKPVCTDCRNE